MTDFLQLYHHPPRRMAVLPKPILIVSSPVCTHRHSCTPTDNHIPSALPAYYSSSYGVSVLIPSCNFFAEFYQAMVVSQSWQSVITVSSLPASPKKRVKITIWLHLVLKVGPIDVRPPGLCSLCYSYTDYDITSHPRCQVYLMGSRLYRILRYLGHSISQGGIGR